MGLVLLQAQWVPPEVVVIRQEQPWLVQRAVEDRAAQLGRERLVVMLLVGEMLARAEVGLMAGLLQLAVM